MADAMIECVEQHSSAVRKWCGVSEVLPQAEGYLRQEDAAVAGSAVLHSVFITVISS
jgi:hypothetical protein